MILKRRNKIKYCECGCGQVVKNRFVHGHAGRCFSEEQKRKMGEAASNIWKDKDFRERMCKIRSEVATKLWKNEEIREKRRIASNIARQSPIFKNKMSKIQKKIWENSPERKENIRGENHWAWSYGKSKEPYSIDWTDSLKTMVKKRDGYRCQRCLTHKSELPSTLNVHHIDYNKKNSVLDNLITLCVSCHIKTNMNREKWESVFASQ
jgi:5-methylcytosine-specific restriction endonuclease McrA